MKPPQCYGEWCSAAVYASDPVTVEEALSGPEGDHWLAAMEKEMDAMRINDVWKLVEPPVGSNIIKNKWIFKRKYDVFGNVSAYKARLVALGYSQKFGTDFDETFSPVVRFESVRTMLAYAAQNDFHVHSMDVSNAYLNSRLQENLYMQQPENFVSKTEKMKVCKLNKAIYGLKQSALCWNESFSSTLKKLDFKQSQNDNCIFTYYSENILCILALYVDDLMIMSNSLDFLKSVKSKLQNVYRMKDLGVVKQFLGVNITQTKGKIVLDQSHYTKKLLEKFGFQNAKTVSTPIDNSLKLYVAKDQDEQFSVETYQSAVGALLFLSTRTRGDICFAVGNVAKYCSNPTLTHWTAVKRIFRYLKGTINFGLCYSSSTLPCIGYSDADFAGDQNDRKSTSGYCFMFGNGAISWRSTKQTCCALSTAEAEYVALSTCTQEGIWLQKLLGDFHIPDISPMMINEDNQSAICFTKNNSGHGRAKHIQIKYHFVKDMINNGKIQLQYCPTTDMLADIFTKGLGSDRFARLRTLLGIVQLGN